MDGVFKGWGGNFGTVAYDTPDYTKLMHLERNVYQFASAKNWQMCKELTRAIKDGDRVLPFREYKNKVMPILDEYNERNLRTEYNAAIAGSQMASKWVQFEEAARLAEQHGTDQPLLQYRTQEDSQVRESHARLNRITRPVDDIFWKTYLPPNGWNCRCTTVRVTSGKKTDDTETNHAMADVQPQKGFTANLAQEGFVFPKDSPYYTNLPADQNKAHLAIQRTAMKKFAKENLVGNKYPSPIGDISINNTGIDKTLSQPHNHLFEKNNAIYKLPEILQSAKHLGSGPDTKKGNVKQLHYLEVIIAGNKNSCITVKESHTGELSLYTIQDNNKSKNK